LTRQPARSTLPGMIPRDSIDAMIRECSMDEEHLSALADAKREPLKARPPLVDLINRIRRNQNLSRFTRRSLRLWRREPGKSHNRRGDPLQPPTLSRPLLLTAMPALF
jgi:hypothetical protein